MKKFRNPIEKRCAVEDCRKVFTVSAFRAYQPTCSVRCGQVYSHRKRAKRIGLEPLPPAAQRERVCPVCADRFTPPGRRPKRCCSPRCAAILRHRQDPNWARRCAAIMRAGKTASTRAREQRLVNGCKTLVEAFRAGQRHERSRWHGLANRGKAELRQEATQ
jgi:hypothetical protein